MKNKYRINIHHKPSNEHTYLVVKEGLNEYTCSYGKNDAELLFQARGRRLIYAEDHGNGIIVTLENGSEVEFNYREWEGLFTIMLVEREREQTEYSVKARSVINESIYLP